MTVDTSKKSPDSYGMKTLFPELTGALSRQDDRYHTVPYRFGILNGCSRSSCRTGTRMTKDCLNFGTR